MLSRLLKRWEVSASTGSHFDVLDGLRGIAILLVVVSHAFYVNPERGFISRVVGYIIEAGWNGLATPTATSFFTCSR